MSTSDPTATRALYEALAPRGIAVVDAPVMGGVVFAKDVKIARDMARSIGAYAPLAEKVSELWSAAAGRLGGELDQTEIAWVWEEATSVKL